MKSTIYETKGRAREFSELALNLFNHCEHGCVYCYAADVLHIAKADFNKPRSPRVTPAEIEVSASRQSKNGDSRRVLLCFTCDPYTPIEAETQITRKTISILHSYGLNVVILTKGGARSMRDFDILTPNDAYATTLTLTTDEASLKWEPGAALPSERIEALQTAYHFGIETWVSFEPVIFPEETFKLLDLTKRFVRHYKVGTMNYHPQGKNTDWGKFGWEMKRRMDLLGVNYYFKMDLLREMGIVPSKFQQKWVCS